MSEEQKSIKFYLLQVSADDIKVNCMESVSAVTFRWPNNEDILVYQEDDVLCEIEPPIPVNQKLTLNYLVKFAPKGSNKYQKEKSNFCMVL